VIIYRAQEESLATADLLQTVRHDLRLLGTSTAPSYDALIGPLIDAGELASAVMDALEPHVDDADWRGDQFIALLSAIASAAEAAWRGDSFSSRWAMHTAWRLLTLCATADVPSQVRRPVSESFAFHGVGPELFSEAACEWHVPSQPPARIVCVGVRTIGVVFAAAVAAALQRRGAETALLTVRPRGYPFDRRVVVGRHFAERVDAWRGATFFVIDEGPGLSGSSIAASASALAQLGVPDDHIVLMPGHTVDASTFANPEVRRRWQRHRVVVPDFEKVWVTSGRLATAFESPTLDDVAAGRWRTRYSPEGDAAVHPQHERRKYIAAPERGTSWIKFAGLGRYGRATVARAQQAAAAGWGPEVSTLAHGFLAMREVPGKPLWSWQASGVTPHRLADYLAFEGRMWKTGKPSTTSDLVQMAVTNTLWLCGDDAAAHLERLIPRVEIEAVRVDGRQYPHEWVGSETSALKTDGVEHHDDRFYPGPVDIAWDVAGAIEEWRLTGAAERALIDHYVAQSDDRSLDDRLPFYRAAYLAFRGGYATFACDQLHDTRDGQRFGAARDHYRARLSQVLSA
jgi:hypothetical protein